MFSMVKHIQGNKIMGDDNTHTITIGEADPDLTWSDPNMTYTFHTSLTDTASSRDICRRRIIL